MTKKYILTGALVLAAVVLGISFLSGPGVPADNSEPTTQEPSNNAKTFTLSEVGAHAVAGDCYSAVSGNVYDLTSWISKHPGGEKAILGICGKDATDAFTDKHGGQEGPETALDGFLIGTLVK